MGLRINTNVQALVAQRNLGTNRRDQEGALERLSSGQRINRAGDDAAGLAISEKMRAHIRSVQAAIRNTSDGVSIIQTTEGGMNEMENILMRFRELAIQASSDTVGDTERSFIDKEVQQLAREIDRISEVVEWNGKRKLLDGQGGLLELQVGINNSDAGDRLALDQAQSDVRLDSLGLSGVSVLTKEDARTNLERIDGAIGLLNSRRATVGALQNRLQSSMNNLMTYHENISQARSRIADADIAQESAELTRDNILTTAGVSVLSQANQNPQLALKLIS